MQHQSKSASKPNSLLLTGKAVCGKAALKGPQTQAAHDMHKTALFRLELTIASDAEHQHSIHKQQRGQNMQ